MSAETYLIACLWHTKIGVISLKILHCTDLHYSDDAISWINNNNENFDVICLTGDFLDDRENSISIDQQINFYKIWFSSFHQPILVCSGNHDYCNDSLSWLEKKSDFLGDGTITNINGIKFGCIKYDSEHFEAYNDCDVILYHVPPKGSSCAIQNGEDFGCSNIRQALRQKSISPQYLLTGHVHRPKKHAIKLGTVIVSNAGGVHKNGKASYAIIELKA